MDELNNKNKINILFLLANPKGTSRLHLDKEIRDISEGIQLSRLRDWFKLEQRLAVRTRDVQRAMLDVAPQIVHFSGHGAGEKGLIFEDEAGQAKFVDDKALASLFELFADRLVCVVLNGCYSKVQAEAIVQYIPHVIGMSEAISDKSALEFSVGFYDALGAGRPVEFAYELGCRAIAMSGGLPDEDLIPVLLNKQNHSGSTVYPTPRLESTLVFDSKPELNNQSKIEDSDINSIPLMKLDGEMPIPHQKNNHTESRETAVDQLDRAVKPIKRKRVFHMLLLLGVSVAGAVSVSSLSFFKPNPSPPKCRPASPTPGMVRVLTSHTEGNKVRWWVAQDGQGLRTFTCPSGNCSLDTISDEQTYLEAETVLAMAWDETVTQPQEIWISTSSNTEGKIFKLFKDEKIWRQTGSTIKQQFCPAGTIAVRPNQLLLGAVDAEQGELYSFDGNHWSNSQLLNIPPETRLQVKSLVLGSSNQPIWVGASVGLYRISEGQVGHSYRPEWIETTSLFTVNSLAVDRNVLWVGTNTYGLLHFNSIQGAWKSIPGLPLSKITSISLSTAQKTALVGTDRGLGICRWNQNYETRCSRIEDPRVQGEIDSVRLDTSGTAFVGTSGSLIDINVD